VAECLPVREKGESMRGAWPYLTDEIPAVPAAYRVRPEDFLVEEIPEYDPCGVGDHLYAWIEKRDLTTRQMVRALAAALGIPPERIGVAGQKDLHGVTRQMVSLERVEPGRLKTLRLPGIAVLDAARHRVKLRLGSLRGNRFAIRLRETAPGAAAAARAALGLLGRRGVPNYFGPQRFGVRGDTWEVGQALLQGDAARARAIIGRWPGSEQAAGPVLGVERWLAGFAVSAYQAWLFNAVLALRLRSLDRLLQGDLAFVHDTGRLVPVRDAAAEQPRAERFLLSATGPIVGHTMEAPTGEPAEIEGRVLAAEGIRPEALPRSGSLKCVGARRPLRFRPAESAVEEGRDELGAFLELRFRLPRGCYATALLREVCKDGLADRAGRADESPSAPPRAGDPGEELSGEGEPW
jgi:tRNA pseudouridine13 synthase